MFIPSFLKALSLSSAPSANSAKACLRPLPAIPASKALLVKTCRDPNSWSTLCPVLVKKGKANLTALDKSSYSIKDFCIACANLSVMTADSLIDMSKPFKVCVVSFAIVLWSPCTAIDSFKVLSKTSVDSAAVKPAEAS